MAKAKKKVTKKKAGAGVTQKVAKKATKKAASKALKTAATSAKLTKSGLIEAIAAEFEGELTKKQVKGVLETLCSVGYQQLNKHGTFAVPGFVKLVVKKKPATKARDGINPFTGEPTVFQAKPARKVVKGRPVKAVKDAVA